MEDNVNVTDEDFKLLVTDLLTPETEEAMKVNDSSSGSHQQDYTQYWHHNQGGSTLPYHHDPHYPPPHQINYHHHHHPHLHQNQKQGAGGIHQNQGAGGNYHSYSSNPQNHHQNGNGDAGITANAGTGIAASTTPIPISNAMYLQQLSDTHAVILSNIIYAQNGRRYPPEKIKKIWKGIHMSMSAVASNWDDRGESSHIGTIIKAQRQAHRNHIDVPSSVSDTKTAASLFQSETEVKKMYESFTPNGRNIHTAGIFLNRLVSLWVWLTLKIQKPQTSSDRLVTDFLNTFCAEVGLPPNSLIFEVGNSKAKLGERLTKNSSGKVRSFPGASTKGGKDGDFWLKILYWITGIPQPFLKGILGNIRVTLVSPPAPKLIEKNEQFAKMVTDTYLMLSPSKPQHTVVMSKNLVFPPSMMERKTHSVKDFCFTILLKLVAAQLNNMNVSGKRVFFIFVVYSYFFSSVLTSIYCSSSLSYRSIPSK